MIHPQANSEFGDSGCRGGAESAGKTAYKARVILRGEALRASIALLLPPTSDLVLEIGCGHGHFLTAYATAHPDRICVGVDIVRDRIERAKRKARRARLTNLHFLNADAEEFLQALPAAVEIAWVFVLFPDPWPKRRHHKNRLIQPAFLEALAKRAGAGATLHFRTDFEPYFETAVAIVKTHRSWEIADQAAWPFEFQTVFQARAPQYFSLVIRRRA
jgi:tRNA (guanine-N7-)-methyltransferase